MLLLLIMVTVHKCECPAHDSEQSICQARAAVMVYDDANKKWVPAGGSTGFSRVHIYHHTGNNTFRVVGRKIQDHQVVINCAIPKGLKYNQATQTFHQWRDARQVYGLNFGSKEDANVFASAMMHALEVLNSQEAAAIAGAKLRKVSRVEDGSFPSGGSTVGVNLASSKTDAGRGNGPLPLGGSGLMEEMSALLARRRRIAEKGSTVEAEQKEDRSEDAEPVTSKASSTSTPEPTRKPWERTNTMNGSKSPVISRPKSTPSSQPSANGVQTEGLDYDRLKQDILEEMRKELAKLKEELIDAIRQELSKPNTA
ncbi:ENAH actin regulator [Cricetulus griseus]